jgi:predicted SAM-dependent methyltransferase
MYEASKAMRRRGDELNKKLFHGKGVDVGSGPDCITGPNFEAYGWDMPDGDAQYLASLADNSQDFVHSSHCLEHMMDPRIALKNWVRVCKPGCYIVCTFPDEQLYEHNMWPSRFNSDHKWSFRMYRGNAALPKSLTVFDLIKQVWKEVEPVSIKRIEDNFNWTLDKYLDQTGPADGPECAIELILRKNDSRI